MTENEEGCLSSNQYYEKLQELYIEEDELDLSSDFEARATLVKLQRLENDVLKVKREISKDIRTIRNMYLDESIIDEPKFLGLISIGKKLTPTQKRKKLLAERESALAPYEEIIIIIDDYIKQIEDLGKYIKNEVLETYSQIPRKKVTKVHKVSKEQ